MNATAETPDPIPAATLVVFRKGRSAPEPEILITIRSRTMSFAGGMAVFPGGRVDPEDYDLAAKVANVDDDTDEVAHRIAAIRETLEETGLALGLTGAMDAQRAADARALLLEKRALAPVLNTFDLSLDLDELTPFARWLPLGLAHNRIFDTMFYLADLGTGAVDIEVDATENTHLFWVSAAEALRMAERGDISLIFPTRRNLERLAQFTTFDEARDHARQTPVRVITPEVVDEPDGSYLTIPDDLGYPITREELTSANRS
ncbi:NUDIX domain-containing protein [Erythrobacter aquimaris]|uniref:NUDIX domain-containing protein n=1 Tax=Qipengyuania aquimaris TaxID=255984 RepID=A0A6I4TIE0_9SPHN|nr:NUDIX domain-containing protein [Qipengyuania aquimaris]MXO94979.1 NUDIX domain-containing protein [Qipengyuania aquimaris]